MRRSSDVATRLVVRKVPMMPRISISRRKGRMIWVRIFSVGIVSRGRTRDLSTASPTLRRDRVGGTRKDQLIGPAVHRGENVAGHAVHVLVAGRHGNRPRDAVRPVALAVDAYPLVGDGATGTVGGEATHGRDRDLRTADTLAVL